MRTQFALEALGELPSFGQVFPLETYWKYRNIYLLEVLKSKDALTVENRKLAFEKGLKVKKRTRLIASLLPQFIAQNISKTFRHLRNHDRVRRVLNSVV